MAIGPRRRPTTRRQRQMRGVDRYAPSIDLRTSLAVGPQEAIPEPLIFLFHTVSCWVQLCHALRRRQRALRCASRPCERAYRPLLTPAGRVEAAVREATLERRFVEKRRGEGRVAPMRSARHPTFPTRSRTAPEGTGSAIAPHFATPERDRPHPVVPRRAGYGSHPNLVAPQEHSSFTTLFAHKIQRRSEPTSERGCGATACAITTRRTLRTYCSSVRPSSAAGGNCTSARK